MNSGTPECLYVLDCDASSFAAAATVQQWQNGKLRVVDYASRVFNSAERSYCATRRELSALIFGLRAFQCYLLGRHFQVRVDNQALTYYQRSRDATGQCARYLDFLANFDFEIVHRRGANHTNVDSISRLRPCEVEGGEPCKQCNKRVTGQHRVSSVQTRAQRRRAESNRATATGDATVGTPSGPGAACGDHAVGKRKRRRKPQRAPLQSVAPTAWQAREI